MCMHWLVDCSQHRCAVAGSPIASLRLLLLPRLLLQFLRQVVLQAACVHQGVHQGVSRRGRVMVLHQPYQIEPAQLILQVCCA